MSTSDETSVSSDQELEADLSSRRKDVLNTSFNIDDVLKVAGIDVTNNDDVPKKVLGNDRSITKWMLKFRIQSNYILQQTQIPLYVR